MRIVALCFTVAIGTMLSQPAIGQTVRVIAVADFMDQSTRGWQIGAQEMSADLQQFLAQLGKERLRVVAVAEVRAALRVRGYTPADLIFPSRAAEIARTVGADWLVTGWWTYLEADGGERESSGGPGMRRRGVSAEAAITVRVVEAASRRILLEDSFWSVSHGGARGPLRQAAQEALRNAAERIAAF